MNGLEAEAGGKGVSPLVRAAGAVLMLASLAVLFSGFRALAIVNATLGLLLGAYVVWVLPAHVAALLAGARAAAAQEGARFRSAAHVGAPPAAAEPAGAETPASPAPVRQVYRREAGRKGDTNREQRDAIQLLALLQARGRFIDFLREDVTRYGDEQVGAAARVLHEGCRVVLDEFVHLDPVHDAPEGDIVELPAGFTASDYRITGDLPAAPPFRVRLLHRGWRLSSLSLPRLAPRADGGWPPVAPAQAEVV